MITAEVAEEDFIADALNLHMQNMFNGGGAAYMKRLIAKNGEMDPDELVEETTSFLDYCAGEGLDCFSTFNVLLCGRVLLRREDEFLSMVGVSQTDHGDYPAFVFVGAIAVSANTKLDAILGMVGDTIEGGRHFGAIREYKKQLHEFKEILEQQGEESVKEAVRQMVRNEEAIYAYGHPAMKAAGRGELDADPRPMVYVVGLFYLLDENDIQLEEEQDLLFRTSKLVFEVMVEEGVVKRKGEAHLRAMPILIWEHY